jgi:5'-phosphate synthase pdxT subunit
VANATTIGVLCLQGDYEAHGRVLDRLGIAWRDVRRTADLEGLRGLILPGGESTTMWHFLSQDGLAEALQDFAGRGGALFGTCAGAILLADEVRNPAGRGLGLLDITVERNGYGRQLYSSVRSVELEDEGGALEAVLIRAPRIRRLGRDVTVRARLDGDAVWVEQGRVMATTFHPELGNELRPHRRFLALAAQTSTPRGTRKRDSVQIRKTRSGR